MHVFLVVVIPVLTRFSIQTIAVCDKLRRSESAKEVVGGAQPEARKDPARNYGECVSQEPGSYDLRRLEILASGLWRSFLFLYQYETLL